MNIPNVQKFKNKVGENRIRPGHYILAMMLACDMPAEGCGIEAGKAYTAHWLLDSVTFREVSESELNNMLAEAYWAEEDSKPEARAFIILNEYGYLATSSVCPGITTSFEKAQEAVRYLREDCGLDDEEFTIVELPESKRPVDVLMNVPDKSHLL